MKANIPANHLRPQNLPAKPVVEIVYGQNFATVFWKSPPFSERVDVAFGTDKEHLKALGETRSGLWQFPYTELDPAKEYYVRVQAKNKAGLGPWSDLKTLRVPAPDTESGPSVAKIPPSWLVFWKSVMPWKHIFTATVRILGLLLAILILALLCKGIWALTGGTHAVAVLPPPPITAVAVAAPSAPTASAAPGGKAAAASGNGVAMVDSSITINNNITTTTTQVVPTENRVSEQNWPAQKPPDMSYNLESGTTEYVIPSGADYVFCPPPPEQGVFSTYPVLIDGNPDMIFIAQNGVRWDRRWNNPQNMPFIHQYRYWNRSSGPARMRMSVIRHR